MPILRLWPVRIFPQIEESILEIGTNHTSRPIRAKTQSNNKVDQLRSDEADADADAAADSRLFDWSWAADLRSACHFVTPLRATISSPPRRQPPPALRCSRLLSHLCHSNDGRTRREGAAAAAAADATDAAGGWNCGVWQTAVNWQWNLVTRACKVWERAGGRNDLRGLLRGRVPTPAPTNGGVDLGERHLRSRSFSL